MSRFILSIYFSVFVISGLNAQFSGDGFYLNFDSSPTGSINLTQNIRDKTFQEDCSIRFDNFRRVQLGMAWMGATPGLLWSDLDMWGLELGGGLNYHSGNIVRDTSLSSTSQIFDYYQMGDQMTVRSVGLSLHAHAGGIFFIGGDVDFGFSKMKSESVNADEYVKDWGGYCIPQLQIGTCIPLFGGRSSVNPKVYLKIYSNNSIVLYRFNKTDWIAPGREFKNYSDLRSSGVMNTVGFSLSYFME